MKYADMVGLPQVLARIREFQTRFGDAWKPAPLLERLAAQVRVSALTTKRSETSH